MAQDNSKAGQTVQEKEQQFKAAKPAESLQHHLDQMEKFGAFDLLESAIDGVQAMNPGRKARKDIFLREQAKKVERDELLKTLEVWADVLSQPGDAAEMIAYSQDKSDKAQQVYKKNVARSLEETRQLERSYRSVALFFKNTESTKVKNVSFLNAEPEQLKDTDNDRFIKAIREELVASYDKLDLRKNYGLLIIPGYLGSNKVLEVYAKIAHDNKVMLVTDFEDLDRPDDVMEEFEKANLTGGDIYRSNVVMTCNWLVGRAKAGEMGETEDLIVPPAGALGGKIYYTLMSQVTAGKKHGSMNEVDGVRFELKKSEIASLEKLGLVPMVNEFGKVMAFSAKTLFNGDNIGLQTYSVVRVFDYVCKVLMDFLNRRAFENFNANTRKEMMSQIVRFLDTITGPGKLIENFDINRFEQDPVQKDRVHLDIRLRPYFPAKNFLIKLEGHKGDDGTKDWTSKYDQPKK